MKRNYEFHIYLILLIISAFLLSGYVTTLIYDIPREISTTRWIIIIILVLFSYTNVVLIGDKK